MIVLSARFGSLLLLLGGLALSGCLPSGQSSVDEEKESHFLAGKKELARTVSLGAVTERQQHEFDRLADENNRLKTELLAWQTRYATNRPGPAAAPTPARAAQTVAAPTPALVSSPPSNSGN